MSSSRVNVPDLQREVAEMIYAGTTDGLSCQEIAGNILLMVRTAAAQSPDTDRFDTVGYPGYRTGMTYGDGYKAALRSVAAKSPHQDPVAWLDIRGLPLADWTKRIVATNREYVKANGPHNFAPLYLAPAQSPSREEIRDIIAQHQKCYLPCACITHPHTSDCASLADKIISAVSSTPRTMAMPEKLSPTVIAACVGGGITSDQITHIYSLIRAAVSLYGEPVTQTPRTGPQRCSICDETIPEERCDDCPSKALDTEEKYIHDLIDSDSAGGVMHGDVEGAFHRLRQRLPVTRPQRTEDEK